MRSTHIVTRKAIQLRRLVSEVHGSDRHGVLYLAHLAHLSEKEWRREGRSQCLHSHSVHTQSAKAHTNPATQGPLTPLPTLGYNNAARSFEIRWGGARLYGATCSSEVGVGIREVQIK